MSWARTRRTSLWLESFRGIKRSKLFFWEHLQLQSAVAAAATYKRKTETKTQLKCIIYLKKVKFEAWSHQLPTKPFSMKSFVLITQSGSILVSIQRGVVAIKFLHFQVCVDCRVKVCASCALFGKHRGHQVRSEEDVSKEISIRADLLVELINQIESGLSCLIVEQHAESLKDSMAVEKE